ncbi:MAG: mechanosensitive ion channel [Breznakibacter sp.]|nr:mechanosensitive ion channel [Breznakibacter sp.]
MGTLHIASSPIALGNARHFIRGFGLPNKGLGTIPKKAEPKPRQKCYSIDWQINSTTNSLIDMNNSLTNIKEFFDNNILEVGNYSLSLYNIISLILFIFTIIVILIILKHLIYRSKTLDASKKFSITKLSRYTIVTLSLLMGLNILGFNISVLLAGSAAIMVGLGFGLQGLFSDFISGIILLLDGTLKVNDIIEVNNSIYSVQEINFRTTTVLGRDDNYIILPNSELTSNKVINWTHGQVSSRFKVTLGVDYSTDISTLMAILKTVAKENQRVLSTPEPFVRFEDYGDSSLIFSVYFYTKEIFRVENTKSEIRIELFKTLKEKGINIPFPQRVVHIKGNEGIS